MGIAENTLEQIKTIGKNKYRQLKRYNFAEMTTEQMVEFRETHKISVAEAEKQIEKYERVFVNSKANPEFLKAYHEKIKKISENKAKQTVTGMTKEWLYREFVKHFFKNEGISFLKNDDTIENLKPLIYYFIGDFENFKKCKNVHSISNPSLKKGLLIIGDYGNGKTSMMKAFESALRPTNIIFKGFSANEIVKMYEGCENPTDKKEFDRKTLRGTRYFDDILTEREASNYGKSNLFKDIFEERYNKNLRTYITCNYNKNFIGNVEKGIEQFGVKYGGRVHDRIFEMFNVIHFTGNSFRE